MLRNLSPPAVAYAAGCAPHVVRDWRSEGFLDGIGERDGKGHLYSVDDVVQLAVAGFLARHGIRLREAFSIVGERAAQISDLVKSESGGAGCGADYVLTFALNPDLSAGYQSISGAPIAQVRLDKNLPGAMQINVSQIVRSVAARLRFYEVNGGAS
jgi:MerR HTH family regulatory protein